MILGKQKLNSWQIVPYIVVIPCICLYLLFFYYTALSGFGYSLTDWNGIDSTYKYIGFQNFIDAFHSSNLISTLKFTLIYAVMTIIFTNVLGLFLAVLLDRKLRGRNGFRALFFFPAVMSTLTVAYVFQQIDYRLISKIGMAIGNQTLANGLFASPVWAPYAVSVVQIWQATPITMVIFLAGLQSVPGEILESSRMDGAGAGQVFLKIKLPLIIPSIMVNMINTAKTGVTAFDVIMGTTLGGPGSVTYSFAMYMYLMFGDLELAYSCAIALIMFVIFGFFAILQIGFFRKREVEL